MTSSKITALALLILFAFITPAHSATYADGFNGAVLDPHAWTTDVYGVAGEVVERNQRLEFVVPQESIPAPINTLTASLSCQSLFQLRGDFDVQVDYGLFNDSRFDNGGVGLTTSDGGVWRYNSDTGGDVYGFLSETPTLDTTGSLRLVRLGGTATGYYYSAGAWVSLGASSFTTDDVSVILAYHNYSDKQIGAPLYLALDNFAVNEGQLVYPVPEPYALLAMMSGIACLVTARRRRRL